jgi:hypothetical protein
MAKEEEERRRGEVERRRGQKNKGAIGMMLRKAACSRATPGGF